MLSNAQDQRLSRAASGDGNRSPSLPMTPLLRKSGAFHSSANENFKVVIRARPPLPRELNGERPFQNIISVDDEEKVITVSENLAAVDAQRLRLGLAAADGALAGGGGEAGAAGPYATHVFTFDHVYEQGASQEKVYRTTAAGVVGSALEGYNATIFAYGQTGTGKTYTMEGFQRGMDAESRGLIPRAIEQIFGHIQAAASPRTRFLVRASYLQIYNEVISDLLKPERNNLAIREDPRRGVFVEGLSEWVVRSPAEIYGLMERGAAVRATGATNMNEVSSRSHAVFIIIAEQSSTYYVDKEGHELPPEAFAELMRRRRRGRAHAGRAAAAGEGGAGAHPARVRAAAAGH